MKNQASTLMKTQLRWEGGWNTCFWFLSFLGLSFWLWSLCAVRKKKHVWGWKGRSRGREDPLVMELLPEKLLILTLVDSLFLPLLSPSPLRSRSRSSVLVLFDLRWIWSPKSPNRDWISVFSFFFQLQITRGLMEKEKRKSRSAFSYEINASLTEG